MAGFPASAAARPARAKGKTPSDLEWTPSETNAEAALLAFGRAAPADLRGVHPLLYRRCRPDGPHRQSRCGRREVVAHRVTRRCALADSEKESDLCEADEGRRFGLHRRMLRRSRDGG